MLGIGNPITGCRDGMPKVCASTVAQAEGQQARRQEYLHGKKQNG